MTDWVRLWHDMPTDPKWRVIARKSGQPLACVISVFTLMLTNASGNVANRGCLLAWNHEDAGAALDMDAESVCAIYDAMQGKVLEGDRLTGWERRQPKREDSGVAARVAKHRATKANAAKLDVTQRNAPDTDADTEEDIPLSNDNGAAPENSDAEFWSTAKAFLKLETSKPGAMLGKWCKNYPKIAVASAITSAQVERPAQRIPYIEAILRKQDRVEPRVPL